MRRTVKPGWIVNVLVGVCVVGFGVLAMPQAATAKTKPLLRGSFVIDGSWIGGASGDTEYDSCAGTGSLSGVHNKTHVLIYSSKGKSLHEYFSLSPGVVGSVSNSDVCQFTFKVNDTLGKNTLKLKVAGLGPYPITANKPFMQILDAANAPANDVTLSQCAIDPDDDTNTTADIAGTIVNHSSLTSDYDIQINILEGPTRIGSAEDDETNIAPGQTSTWSTYGDMTAASGAITCQLVEVGRTPSN
jgi:hypothetical protein